MMQYFRIEPVCDENGAPRYKAFCDTLESEKILNEIIFSSDGTEKDRASRVITGALPLSSCNKKPLGDITFFPWFDMVLSEKAFKLLNVKLLNFGDFYPIHAESAAPSESLKLFGFKVWAMGDLQGIQSNSMAIFVQPRSPYRTLIREDVIQTMLDAGLTGFVTIPMGGNSSTTP